MTAIIFILACAVVSRAQFDSIGRRSAVAFLSYLEKKGQADDAVYLLSRLPSRIKDDSLMIAQARGLLALKREKEALSLLAAFKPAENKTLNKVTLLQNHARLLMQRNDSVLAPECAGDTLCEALYRIQLMAALLLKEDHRNFDVLFKSFSSRNALLTLSAYNLYVYSEQWQDRRKKSPAVAGILSAIVPGTGRLYAGKPHEALHTFLPVAFNIAQSAEGFYHKQYKSPHFYVFGSMAAFFHVANIAGSVRAAKRKTSEEIDLYRLNIEHELSKLLKYYN